MDNYMDNYSVYIHIAPNGKSYIGITRQDPIRRWHGGSGYRSQPKFYNAIKKYGWDNFFHGILLTDLSEKNACAIEQYLIDRYDTINNGYNQTSGGTIGFTRIVTDETKQKISNALKGKPHSPERKEKCIKQLAENRLARQRNIYCVETGEIFNSAKEAADAYNLHPGHITSCCRGKRKTSGKLHWKYWEVTDGEMARIRVNQRTVG